MVVLSQEHSCKKIDHGLDVVLRGRLPHLLVLLVHRPEEAAELLEHLELILFLDGRLVEPLLVYLKEFEPKCDSPLVESAVRLKKSDAVHVVVSIRGLSRAPGLRVGVEEVVLGIERLLLDLCSNCFLVVLIQLVEELGLEVKHDDREVADHLLVLTYPGNWLLLAPGDVHLQTDPVDTLVL